VTSDVWRASLARVLQSLLATHRSPLATNRFRGMRRS